MHYDKLSKEDKHKIKEAIYEMMATNKTTPLDISNSLPKLLFKSVE